MGWIANCSLYSVTSSADVGGSGWFIPQRKLAYFNKYKVFWCKMITAKVGVGHQVFVSVDLLKKYPFFSSSFLGSLKK